jgi:multimeric flavodoxin WrbA
MHRYIMKAMKIIGINGSPRGDDSQTRRLVMAVLEGARKAGADITFIDVCKLDIHYCNACGACYAKGECIHDDDFTELAVKMMEADGIVLGSPVYINSVTAQLKTMFDRMADIVHCQAFSGKYGCSVSTAGGSMAEETARYMNSALTMFGATTIGTAAVNFMGNPNAIAPAEKKAKELGKALAEAIRSGWKDPEQEQVLAERGGYMKQLVLANKDLWTHEYEYWKGKGGV